MLAGERFAPHAYKDTPLKDVLPIDVTERHAAGRAGRRAVVESYRLELTPTGRMHPIFRFSRERTNDEIWGRLKEFYWYADGYQPKRAAEVLASTRGEGRRPARGGRTNAAAGRAAVRRRRPVHVLRLQRDVALALARGPAALQPVLDSDGPLPVAQPSVGRIELRLDRQTPYRRGEPIKVTVRFPDDEQAAADGHGGAGASSGAEQGRPASETDACKLTQLEGSRATFEAMLTQTPEGEYQFWLSSRR